MITAGLTELCDAISGYDWEAIEEIATLLLASASKPSCSRVVHMPAPQFCTLLKIVRSHGKSYRRSLGVEDEGLE